MNCTFLRADAPEYLEKAIADLIVNGGVDIFYIGTHGNKHLKMLRKYLILMFLKKEYQKSAQKTI